MSFANLKKSRSASMDKLVKAAEAVGGDKKSYGDDRYWKPTRDKSGNGFAIVRFLPQCEGEDVPWVKFWDHFFKGKTGKWYVEKSLTTLGQDDPASEYNSMLWNSTDDDKGPERTQARDQKRKLHYVCNVLVVSDPANPANEGKTFLYDFGQKIFDKLMDKMRPEHPSETPMNPFDYWAGADFKIKIRKVQGYVNYDASEFAAPSELFDGDEGSLEDIYGKTYKLQELVAPDQFKTYAELKAKLNQVLGDGVPMSTAEDISLDSSEEYVAPKEEAQKSPGASAASDDDDTLSYFAKLAEG